MLNNKEMNPGKLLEISGSYWQTCTLHAAIRLDIFSIIGNRLLTSEDVSDMLQSNQRGVEMLLNALSAMNLLEKKENTYSNTPLSLAFLVKNSSRYIGHIIMHHYHLVDSWNRLDVAVRTGQPVRGRVSHTDEERRESFLMGMFNLAMNLAPVLVPKINLSNRHHLLDFGGGPGTYAIHFCLNNPQLKATVYDLPTTRPFAEKTIAKFNLQDRIDFKNGDYLEEEIKGIFDVAWLSHILHGESFENGSKIVRKAVSSLEPGGLIIIHEFILNNTMDGPLFPALFSLNMLLGTPGGQAYSEEQLITMLSDAGVMNFRRIYFDSPNDSGILTGIVG
jgi:O-methyltransferase domain/Dimerisation domain